MCRILCVDDHADSRELVKVMIRQHDPSFEVVAVGDALEAMRLIAERPFDLYVLDCYLPETDGFELCRWIKLGDPAVPVIFLSAAARKADRDRASKVGGTEFLVKPLGITQLTASIRRSIGECAHHS